MPQMTSFTIHKGYTSNIETLRKGQTFRYHIDFIGGWGRS